MDRTAINTSRSGAAGGREGSATQRVSDFHNRFVANSHPSRQSGQMGKRSGVPHRSDELAKLAQDQLEAELQRARMRLTIAGSAKIARQWYQRIHLLESALAKRD